MLTVCYGILPVMLGALYFALQSWMERVEKLFCFVVFFNIISLPVIICRFSRIASCKVKSPEVLIYVHLGGCLCAPKIHPWCVAALRKFCLKRNLLPKNKCKAIKIRLANRVARLQFIGAMATPCHYRNLRLKLSG